MSPNKPEGTMSERFDEKFNNQGEFKMGSKVITYASPDELKEFFASEIAREKARLLEAIAEIKDFGGDEGQAYELVYKLKELF